MWFQREMNMGRDSTRPGSEDPIEVCRRLLALREFTLCRIHAHMARESDPNSPELAQILAIADVLLASESRISSGLLDYYSILQVARQCETGPVIINQFKKLMMLLVPSKNRFPFSQEAFNFICQAWSVLSKPEKKEKYDHEIATVVMMKNAVGDRRKQKTHVANAGGSGVGREEKQKEETFWTICPYCCFLYEYAKAYKELCLRCQICRRAFHGMELGPLPASLTADGVDKYICQIGVFRFGYPSDGFFSPKENNAGASVGGTNTVVEVSDESDHHDHDGDGGGDNCAANKDAENGKIGVRPEVAKQETVKGEGVVNLVMGRLNGKRVKMTAWNTEKGRRMRMRRAMKKRKIAEPTAREKSCGCDDDDDDGADPEIIEVD